MLEQAEWLLPQWVRWLPVLWIPIAFLGAAGIARLAVRSVMVRGKLDKGNHWTERARLLFSVRLAAFAAFMGATFVAPLVTQVGELSAIPPGLLHSLVFLTTAAGIYFGGYRRAVRMLKRPKSLARRFKDAVVIGMLVLPGYVVLALLLPFAGWPAASLGVGLVWLLAWRGGFWFITLVGLARPADASLQQRVDRLCERAGERAVPVWVLDWSMGNAFALVHERKIAFSSRCRELLDKAEADAIAGHELGHLTEESWVRLLRLLAGVAPMCVLLVPEIGLWALLAFMVWLVLGRWLAARMERRADREAAALTDSTDYARALLRLHEDALIPAVVGVSGGPHGSLYDRMLAVGVQPDFPRPEKPRLGRALAWVAAYMVFGMALAICTRALYRPGSIHGLEIAAALDDLDVPRLARKEALRGSRERARVFAEAGVLLRPERAEALYSLLFVELLAGNCERIVDLEKRLTAQSDAAPYLARVWRRPDYQYCRLRR